MRNLLALLVLSTACAATLTPAGQRVMITRDKTQVDGCSVLGVVRETGDGWAMGGLSSINTDEKLKTKIRNKAGTVNATHVLLIHHEVGAGTIELIGHAYRCSYDR
jgi:hypothetical protein